MFLWGLLRRRFGGGVKGLSGEWGMLKPAGCVSGHAGDEVDFVSLS